MAVTGAFVDQAAGERGQKSRNEIREFMRTHLGCRSGDVAAGTRFTVKTAQYHMTEIRREWLRTLKRGEPMDMEGLSPLEKGMLNMKRVRKFMEDHIGCTRTECAYGLGLSASAVEGHAKIIKKEWQDEKRTTDGN